MAMMTALEARRLRKKAGHGRAPRFPTQAPGRSKMPAGAGHTVSAGSRYQVVIGWCVGAKLAPAWRGRPDPVRAYNGAPAGRD
jgi:hypothetical protein